MKIATAIGVVLALLSSPVLAQGKGSTGKSGVVVSPDSGQGGLDLANTRAIVERALQVVETRSVSTLRGRSHDDRSSVPEGCSSTSEEEANSEAGKSAA